LYAEPFSDITIIAAILGGAASALRELDKLPKQV
jgi:hypothetical protein